MADNFLDIGGLYENHMDKLYRVFKLDMIYFKRLLGHQKCTFKS